MPKRIRFLLLSLFVIGNAMASPHHEYVLLQAEQDSLPMGMRHRHPHKAVNQLKEREKHFDCMALKHSSRKPFEQQDALGLLAAPLPKSASQVSQNCSLQELKEQEEEFLTWLSKKSYPVNLGIIIKNLYTLVDRPQTFRNYAGSHYGAREEHHLRYLFNLAYMVKILKPYIDNEQTFAEAVKSHYKVAQDEDITFLRDIIRCCASRRHQAVKNTS
jgi:hypothetical protein